MIHSQHNQENQERQQRLLVRQGQVYADCVNEALSNFLYWDNWGEEIRSSDIQTISSSQKIGDK